MLRLLTMALTALCFTGCSLRTPPTLTPTDTLAPARAQVATAPSTASASTSTPTPAATPIATATATRQADPDLLLPDLQTLPPSDLRIEIDSQNGDKLLRFTNSILNGGADALEVRGVFNLRTGKTAVTQYIVQRDGSAEEHAAGEFVFHPGHDHWHLENFALYQVWSLTRQGDLDAVVAFADKISYCLRDDSRADIPGAPRRPVYTNCDQELQGMSVGWIDTYEYDTPGQIVDITALADGLYALRSTVDPENHLWESDDTNNSAVLYLEIGGGRVRVVENENALRRLFTPEN